MFGMGIGPGSVVLVVVIQIHFIREITDSDMKLNACINSKGWAKRCYGLVAAGLFFVAVGGCSIAGQWRTSQRELPPHWTIAEMTLTEDGRYTSTDADLVNTETGRYQWNGATLELLPTDGPNHVYSGRMAGDGALLLSEPNQKNDTVRFEKMDE